MENKFGLILNNAMWDISGYIDCGFGFLRKVIERILHTTRHDYHHVWATLWWSCCNSHWSWWGSVTNRNLEDAGSGFCFLVQDLEKSMLCYWGLEELLWLVRQIEYPLTAAWSRWCAVNDLGVDRKGTGSSKRLADEVVDIIRSRGGMAVPNYGKLCN